MRTSKAVALGIVLTLTATVPAAAGEADWRQGGYDGGHSRFNIAESTLRPRNVSRLRLDWVRRIRPDVTFIYEYMAAPFLVADGRVFGAWSGSEAPYDVLAAFDESTGERLWTRRFADGVWPVAASGSTTVVDRWLVRTPGVLALDASTGSTRWSLEGAEPVVSDRAVRHVIATERETDVRRILSIEVASGEVLWSRRLRVRGWSPWSPSVLLARRLVVVPVWTGTRRRLVVVRTDDGATAWSMRARGTPVAVANGTILTIRVDRRHEGSQIVEGIDLERGRILWSFRSPAYTTIGAAGGGRAFVDHLRCMEGCEGDYGGTYRSTVTALDLATGRVLWRRAGNEAHGTVAWWAEALANSLLYVDRLRHGRATFGALDASTGRLRWVSTFGPRGVSGAIHIVANGAVFGALRFGERGGRIVRLAMPRQARSGASRGRDGS